MGKSASEQVLRRLGVPVIDTDELARRIVEPGEPALDDVCAAFGHEFIGPDGRLRRDALAAKVFADPAARATLEQLLHPRIRQLWKQQVERWRSENHRLAVVVIPLFVSLVHPPRSFRGWLIAG
jgi:dephospho-CoA kinase